MCSDCLVLGLSAEGGGHHCGSSCCSAFLKGLSSSKGNRKGSGPELGWGRTGATEGPLEELVP